MWRCFMKGRAFSDGICALSLLLAVPLLASCGANSSKAELPPPPPPSQAPMISVLFPSCAPAGEPVQLGVVGNNFLSSSVVRWNGSDRPTTMDAINGLVAQISASDVATAGTAEVTVFNPGSGGGTSNSSTFTTMTGSASPQSIAVDPAGKFAYVADAGCNGGAGGYVSMYTIDPTTGALASTGPPVPTNDGFTDSVTVDPSGKFAYVTSSGDVWDIDFGSIVTYSINPTTGALTPTTGGLIGTGVNGTPGYFNSMAFDPSGKFAYAADGGAFPEDVFGGSSSVSMYTVNSTTGALTSFGMIATESGPNSVALDPTGKFAYVANFNSNDVSMYTIDATTGALASIGTIAAGTQPVSYVEDPVGNFAYVANAGSNDLSMYTINATTGALTSMGTISAGVVPISVVVDPSGKFAYAVNFNSNDISMYTINATTGALTSTGTITSGQSPTSIAIRPSGNFAYVTNSASNDISIYSIDGATGALTLIGTIGT
jgi:6-phosphogluconolactonase (cycloisomerase 2 family)